jgi:CheY-like chemotaxis protein
MAIRQRARRRGRNRPRLPQARPGVQGGENAASVQTVTPRRKTILVVEDNATIGGLLVALLREEGYRALRAWDSREAIRIARDRRPSVIVFDLSLPYRDGLPVLHELKQQPETGEAPMVIVSGNTLQLSPGERDLLSDCLAKPVDLDKLINCIRRAAGDPEHDVPEKHYTGTVDSNLYGW